MDVCLKQHGSSSNGRSDVLGQKWLTDRQIAMQKNHIHVSSDVSLIVLGTTSYGQYNPHVICPQQMQLIDVSNRQVKTTLEVSTLRCQFLEEIMKTGQWGSLSNEYLLPDAPSHGALR